MRDKWSFCVTPHALRTLYRIHMRPELAETLPTETTTTTLSDSVGKLTADDEFGNFIRRRPGIVCAWCAK